ncbi:porin family protein [Coprobacter sp.]
MRSRILLLFCMHLLFAGIISAQSGTLSKKRFNWGIRAGVNAPFVDMRKSQINGIKIEELSTNSKMGLFISLFSRINFKRHYLQLETATHYTRYRMSLPTEFVSTTETRIYAEAITIGNKIYSFDIPLLYGYNFIKQGPYELSFFVGPKLKYLYKRKNELFAPEPYEFKMDEHIRPLTANFVLGLGTSISRFSIDFRYEFGITNLTHPTTYTLYKDGTSISEGNIYLKRGINLLSFSIGIIL